MWRLPLIQRGLYSLLLQLGMLSFAEATCLSADHTLVIMTSLLLENTRGRVKSSQYTAFITQVSNQKHTQFDFKVSKLSERKVENLF